MSKHPLDGYKVTLSKDRVHNLYIASIMENDVLISVRKPMPLEALKYLAQVVTNAKA